MSFVAIWSGNFCHLRNSLGGNCCNKLLRSGFASGKVSNARTCNVRSLATNLGGNNKKSQRKKPNNINLNLHNGPVKSSINKPELHELKAVQCYNLPHISEKKLVDWPAVIIVFDIETTGFGCQKERIIEIALRDLSGGKNSTFQTLINPGKYVSNSDVHGIRSDMVNRPDVPRFEEMLPILLQYIRSRQKNGKQVALVAHNGLKFDVPFLTKEFQRCSVEIPEDFLFVDTLLIGRKLILNPDGSKLKSYKLDELRQFYDIPVIGPAHRAMADVNTLAYVLQRMTFQLKLTIPELLDSGFRAADIIKPTP